MKTFLLAAASVTAMAVAAPGTAATINYVENGSFEDVSGATVSLNRGSWRVYSDIAGWTPGSGGVELQTNPTLGNIDAQDGYYYAELDTHRSGSNSSIGQSIDLTAGSYQLSFYYSPRISNDNSNTINYSVAGAGGSISGADADTAIGSWTQVVMNFTLAADETVLLSFAAGGREDTVGGLLDNVSIAPVPVPAAGFLLLGGLAGLGALGARRKS